MSLLLKEPVKRVEQVLKAFDPKLTVIVLKTSARTAMEAASSLGCEVGAIVKSLLFKTENSFTLCLVAGDRKASIIKIKKTLNIKDVSMASADEVKDVTGFTIGGVSPVGHLNKIDVFIDNSLKRFESLYAAAGHPNCVFKLDFINLQKITNGSIKRPIKSLFDGRPCTWFEPSKTPMAARKQWIAGTMKPVGQIVIDDGAVNALKNGSSLLPTGVKSIDGDFERGDVVEVYSLGNLKIGVGLSSYSAKEGKSIMWHKSDEIGKILSYSYREEMIHKDDLVLL